MKPRSFAVLLLFLFAFSFSCTKKKESADSEPTDVKAKTVQPEKDRSLLGKKFQVRSPGKMSKPAVEMQERLQKAPMGKPQLFIRQAKSMDEVTVDGPVGFLKSHSEKLTSCCEGQLNEKRRAINFLTTIELSDKGRPTKVNTRTFRPTSGSFKQCIERTLSEIPFPPRGSVDESRFPRAFRVAMICQDSSVTKGFGSSSPGKIKPDKSSKETVKDKMELLRKLKERREQRNGEEAATKE